METSLCPGLIRFFLERASWSILFFGHLPIVKKSIFPPKSSCIKNRRMLFLYSRALEPANRAREPKFIQRPFSADRDASDDNARSICLEQGMASVDAAVLKHSEYEHSCKKCCQRVQVMTAQQEFASGKT